jgi:hypothetical protein
VAEQRVSRAQTRERGPPSVLAEISFLDHVKIPDGVVLEF